MANRHIWLSLAGALFGTSCTLNEQPLERADAGAGTPSARKSSAETGGAAGESSRDAAVMAIFEEAGLGGEGGQPGPSAAELEVVSDICLRVCATYRALDLTGGICENGSKMYHDVIYPPHAAIPDSDPARNCPDPDWVPECLGYFVNNPQWRCELWDDYCTAEGVWDCDTRGWSVKTCPGPYPKGC